MIISNDIDPRTAQVKRLTSHKRKKMLACGKIIKTRSGRELWMKGGRS